METVLNKFIRLSDTLNSELFECETQIHLATVALLARCHMCLIGEPGIAKSYLVDRLMAYIDGVRYAKIPLHPHASPDELLGPLDIEMLAKGRRVRNHEGYAPWADVLFEDEVWEGSPSLHKVQHDLLNERTWRNDGRTAPVNLSTCFGAANKLPSRENNAAIFDRFDLRLMVQGVTETSNRLRMLDTDPEPHPEPILSWDEVVQAQQQTAAVKIPEAVQRDLVELWRLLETRAVRPSPRRMKASLRVLRAVALLDGRYEVQRNHFHILVHMMWSHPDQIPIIDEVVLGYAHPAEKEALKLLEEIEKLGRDVEAAIFDEDYGEQRSYEIHEYVMRARADVRELKKNLDGSRRLQDLYSTCRLRLHEITRRMLVELFQQNPDELNLGTV